LIAYADTGFLASLYLSDVNSPAATALIRSSPVFVLSPLIEAEFANAIQLAVFRKQVTPTESRSIHDAFSHHQRSGLFRPTPFVAEMWEKACEISRHTAAFGTRTLDVLHVASALLLKPDVFFTFDRRQAKLARAVRLKVAPG